MTRKQAAVFDPAVPASFIKTLIGTMEFLYREVEDESIAIEVKNLIHMARTAESTVSGSVHTMIARYLLDFGERIESRDEEFMRTMDVEKEVLSRLAVKRIEASDRMLITVADCIRDMYNTSERPMQDLLYSYLYALYHSCLVEELAKRGVK